MPLAAEPSTDVPGSMMQHQFTVSERIRDLDRLSHTRFCDQNVAVLTVESDLDVDALGASGDAVVHDIREGGDEFVADVA